MNDSRERKLIEFYNANFGDIIYAKRPEANPLDDPENRHSTGPFIVLTKVNDKLICFPCTSSEGKLRFEILDHYDELPKGGYINFRFLTEISEEDFLYSLRASLSERDKEQVKKHFALCRRIFHSRDYDVQNLNIDTNFQLSARDIVSYSNNKYLVIGDTEKYLFLLPIKDFDYLHRAISERDYDVNAKTIMISRNRKIKYQGTIRLDNYFEIKSRLGYGENWISNWPLQIGYLLQKNGEYYYVYDIQGNQAYCYGCLPCAPSDEDAIEIENMFFKPMFDDNIRVSKNNNLENVFKVANVDEIQRLTAKIKKYKKKGDMFNYIYGKEKGKIKVGSIVEFSDIDSKFLIAAIRGKMIDVINLEALLKDGELVIQPFNVREAYLNPCTDISSEELSDIQTALAAVNYGGYTP